MAEKLIIAQLTLQEARILAKDLNRAIEESEDHGTVMSASCYEAGFSVHVNPHLVRNEDMERTVIRSVGL